MQKMGNNKSPIRIGIVFGTRPEAIKLAAVIHEARGRDCEVVTINSGQHRELLDPILKLFRVSPTHNLEVMRDGQSLHDLTSRLAKALGQSIASESLDYVLVQGDTTTAYAGALAAFYEQIPVGHVEAGLRTNDRYAPFPEETNRRLISAIATDHFAPTINTRSNLLREGHEPSSILVTGNTVIDALRIVTNEHQTELAQVLSQLSLNRNTPYVLMTIHRRENHGAPLQEIVWAVRDFLHAHRDLLVVLPVHRNPAVRDIIFGTLGDEPNIRIIEAQHYVGFIALMRSALFILTDSGGIQEEAPYFNRRTLVLRDSTERPEAIESGAAILVGTTQGRVRSEMESALIEARSGTTIDLQNKQPFGDGFASKRILNHILASL